MKPEHVEIVLDDGRQLRCSCYIVSSSDRGTLIYTPSDRATRNFIRVAENEGRKLFGNHPVIVIPPVLSRDDEGRPHLPRYRLVGEFTSDPMDRSMCWSKAIIVWYQSAPFPVIGDDVHMAFRSITWNALALDEAIQF